MLAINGGKAYRRKPFPKWPKSDEREATLINEVLESGNWWRVTGEKVKKFEKYFSKFQNTEYCLGVTSGTHAIELSLASLGIGKGDEVVLPAFTYISTGSAVVCSNATPVLVDVDEETFCISTDAFEAAITAKTKAVIAVHMAGNACDMERICEIANKYGIKVIEDSAHGHGGEYKGRRLGSIGNVGIFSFQNGKLMTCGEGGAIVTNDNVIYENAYLRHGVGRPLNDSGYNHNVLGSTSRMSEFHAAILLAQMERVDDMNKLREKNAVYLDRLLSDIDGVIPQKRSKGTTIFTHYMYMFYFDSSKFNGMTRNEFVEVLRAEGIPANIAFPVVSDTKLFREQNFDRRIDNYKCNADLSFARKIANEVICMPHCVLEGDESDLEDIRGAILKIQKEIY